MLGRRCRCRDARRPALATDGDTWPLAPMLRLRFLSSRIAEFTDAMDTRLRASDAIDALLPRLRASDANEAWEALEALEAKLGRRALRTAASLPRRCRDMDDLLLRRALPAPVAELMLCRR